MSRKKKVLTSLQDLRTALEEPLVGGDFGPGDFVIILENSLAHGKAGIIISARQFSAVVGFFDGRFAPRERVIRLDQLAELTPELWHVWHYRNPLHRKKKRGIKK